MRTTAALALWLVLALPLSAAGPRRGPAPASSAPQRGPAVVQPVVLAVPEVGAVAAEPARAEAHETGADQPFIQPAARTAQEASSSEAQAEAEGRGREIFDGMAKVNPLEDAAPPLLPQWARRMLTLGRAKPYVAQQRSYGPVFDARTASQLSSVSSLGREEADGLIGWLRGADIPWSGALPFPSDTTFSLELEFLTREQMPEELIERITGPMTETERQRWRKDGKLPNKRWKPLNAHVLAEVEAAMPKGWRFNKGGLWSQKEGSFQEIMTANPGGVFHLNSAKDWAELAAGIEAVQRALPGGLHSVHLHTSRQSEILKPESKWSRLRLKADPLKFMRVVANHEGLWRGLMGLPFSRASAIGYPAKLMFDADNPLYANGHDRWVNLSANHPTMEHKNVTYLLKNKKLDATRLRQDLWASFVLFDYVMRAEEPTQSQGLPVTAGIKPSRKQILLFVDQVFKNDLVGKALALRRLTSLEAEPQGAEHADKSREAARLYRNRGLGVLWDLHARHGGRDERLAEHLREDGGDLLRRLAAESKAQGYPRRSAERHLPPEIRAEFASAFDGAGPAALPTATSTLPN